jgi:hypothetical protein
MQIDSNIIFLVSENETQKMNTVHFQIWSNSVLLVLFTLLPAAPSKSHTAKKARLAEGTMYSDMGCDME